MHQVSSKCPLQQAVPAGCSPGQQRSPVPHLHPLISSCRRDDWKKGGGCLSVLSTHPPTTVAVGLGCCFPKCRQPRGWQEEIHTGPHAYDGWTEGLAHGPFSAPTPTSNTSFSNQPCFGAQLASGKVLPCLQSTQWLPTPPDLIPCTPRWCSPP